MDYCAEFVAVGQKLCALVWSREDFGSAQTLRPYVGSVVGLLQIRRHPQVEFGRSR